MPLLQRSPDELSPPEIEFDSPENRWVDVPDDENENEDPLDEEDLDEPEDTGTIAMQEEEEARRLEEEAKRVEEEARREAIRASGGDIDEEAERDPQDEIEDDAAEAIAASHLLRLSMGEYSFRLYKTALVTDMLDRPILG